jgi:hypothetical protein
MHNIFYFRFMHDNIKSNKIIYYFLYIIYQLFINYLLLIIYHYNDFAIYNHSYATPTTTHCGLHLFTEFANVSSFT